MFHNLDKSRNLLHQEREPASTVNARPIPNQFHALYLHCGLHFNRNRGVYRQLAIWLITADLSQSRVFLLLNNFGVFPSVKYSILEG